jgi:hypothetical protein
MAYLTIDQFKDLALCPAEYVDTVETQHPGWCLAQLGFWSGMIDARLAKRYQTPFASDSPPVVVQGWLARLMSIRVLLKRGIDPTDAQVASLEADATSAMLEIKEAADSKDGLYELPLRQDAPSANGVTKGTPLYYSEQSPYTWMDLQECEGRAEDRGNR